MAQERIFGTGDQRREESELPEPGAPAPTAPTAQSRTSATCADDLHSEIDGVIESNAEVFVKGFVQKGGQ